MPGAYEEDIDRLYGLPLDEFTRGRDELARRIRQEGDGTLAAEVKQLRKPALPAWVVNQLARRRELDVQRLLKAGAALASAQAEAMRAQSGDAFLDARHDQQHALERLAAEAREILADAGRSPAVLDRVLATLRAGSLTEEGRALLQAGRLEEELEPPGFEALAGAAPAAPEPRKRRAPTAEARRRVRDLRKELRGLEAQAASAERRVAQLGKELDAAEAESAQREGERRRVEEELAAAERLLDE